MLKLTLKNILFNWFLACQKTFELLKKNITTISMLRYYDKSKQIVLEIDFSNYVNDEILSQYDEEENLHLVVFYSKNLLLAKCNYEIYDKELLVIIRCLKR